MFAKSNGVNGKKTKFNKQVKNKKNISGFNAKVTAEVDNIIRR